MLQNLHVKNLALIDEVEITFHEHLNILTGETGAGKSILIGSIESALGKKVSKDMIRPGEKEAVIELLFWIDDPELIREIESFDLTVEEGQVFIKRVIHEKRSINKINDSTVTLQTLREVSHRLFDLHGQQENQTLLKEKNHLTMLDHFLEESDRKNLRECQKTYQEYTKISQEIEELAMDDQKRLREIGFLEHEINEIEAAELVSGEDEELEQQYRKMLHSREIAAACGAASRLTGYEEDTAIGNQLTESIRQIQEVSHLDEKVEQFHEQLLQIEDLLGSLHQEMADYIEDMEFDPQTFAETEERLNLINSLKDKYGRTIEDVVQYAETSAKRLEALQNAEEQIQKLKQQREKIREQYHKSAVGLSAARKKIAKMLEKEITKALEDLNFLSVAFKVQVTEEETMTSDGINRIRFLISTNQGLPLRPVQEVASGGELSRIMLAMKSVLAEVDKVETLIFDEIDTGISGETANRVAKKMAVISRKHQVIAITHLPQIAAMADSHYYIEKKTDQNKTATEIRQLSEKESLEEISRMISGNERTETSMKNAEEMKSLANDAKLY